MSTNQPPKTYLAMIIVSAVGAVTVCSVLALVYGWPAAVLCLVAMLATMTFCIGVECRS